MREFDEAYTAPYFGFLDAEAYYHRASAMRVVDRIRVPALVISSWADKETSVTRVRASTLFFDQALDRFFSTLPLASPVEVV